jgi:hypothetical protein
MPAARNFETFLFQSGHPDHVNARVFQLLGTLALDKVGRFSNTDETSAHSRSDEGIGAGRKAGCANGTGLHSRVHIETGKNLVDAWGSGSGKKRLNLGWSEGI